MVILRERAARLVPPYLSKTALRRLPPPRLSAATGCSRWTGGDSDHESGATAVFYHPVPEAPVWPDPGPFLSPSYPFPAFLISLGHPISSRETGERGASITPARAPTLLGDSLERARISRSLFLFTECLIFLPSSARRRWDGNQTRMA